MTNAIEGKCVPCEGGVPTLERDEVNELLQSLPEWISYMGGTTLRREYKFKNFAEAIDFVNKTGHIAESEGHHPDIELGWGYVNIKLMTHAISGLSMNDFIMASKIEETFKSWKWLAGCR